MTEALEKKKIDLLQVETAANKIEATENFLTMLVDCSENSDGNGTIDLDRLFWVLVLMKDNTREALEMLRAEIHKAEDVLRLRLYSGARRDSRSTGSNSSDTGGTNATGTQSPAALA